MSYPYYHPERSEYASAVEGLRRRSFTEKADSLRSLIEEADSLRSKIHKLSG
jgi:hypothetical protein